MARDRAIENSMRKQWRSRQAFCFFPLDLAVVCSIEDPPWSPESRGRFEARWVRYARNACVLFTGPPVRLIGQRVRLCTAVNISRKRPPNACIRLAGYLKEDGYAMVRLLTEK
jgi:hypothetical protein